jgi:hypothetical protein
VPRHSVDASVGEAPDVSVPGRWDGVAATDDLLALVVPDVEVELGVFADHAVEEAIEEGVVVHELGPEPRPEAGCMWEPAGPLGTRRELERHVGRSVAEARPLAPMEPSDPLVPLFAPFSKTWAGALR